MNASAANVHTFTPRIGARWPAAGGTFVSASNGSALVLGARNPVLMTWPSAMRWAAELTTGRHRDFRLPTVAEFQYLHRVVPHLIHLGSTAMDRYWCYDALPDDTDSMCFAPAFTDTFQSTPWGRQFALHSVAIRIHTL